MDSKDGLRELIEMRNNKRNNNRGLLNNLYNANENWSDDTNKDRFRRENDSIINNGGIEVKEENCNQTADQNQPTNLAKNQTSNVDSELPKSQNKEDSDSEDNYQEEEEANHQSEQTHDDNYEDLSYDDQNQETSDSNLVPPDDQPVPMTMDNNQNVAEHTRHELNSKETTDNSGIWTLPAERSECTLEEIRRGQVMNKTAPNECPVLGCGKKINEMRIEPSPGTIASGLRTHVLFVHYGNRKITKKRKLGWSSLKRRNQPSPKKQVGLKSNMSPSHSRPNLDLESAFSPAPSLQTNVDLAQQEIPSNRARQQAFRPNLLDTIQKLVRQPSAERASSIQNLMQITKTNKQKNNADTTLQPKTTTEKLNPTTSSLFSILAGLTQQQQANQPQQLGPSMSRNVRTAQGANTINISQCSRNSITTNGSNSRTVNSSLLSLLNEKITNNVSSSLQAHIKKNMNSEPRNKISTSTPMQSVLPPPVSYQSTVNDNTSFNNSTSILNSLCSGNGDNRLAYDNSIPLNSFIESIAIKTGSNIGQAGIAEAKKILEKFTSSLICSSQTIADHYLAPFGGEVPQQKPEISPSDVMLAYKMMHKSHGQP